MMNTSQTSNFEHSTVDKTRKLKKILFKKKRTDEDINLLVPFIQNIEFFNKYNFEQKDMEYICHHLKYHSCCEGEKVFLYNSEGDKSITDYTNSEGK